MTDPLGLQQLGARFYRLDVGRCRYRFGEFRAGLCYRER